MFPLENRRPPGGGERVDRPAMAPLGFGQQSREFRLAPSGWNAGSRSRCEKHAKP